VEQEKDQDLLRSRQKLLDQQTELRKHIQALLRRNGRHFKAETHFKPFEDSRFKTSIVRSYP
jgi:hypothetical protein